MFYSEFCEIFKNTYFEKHLLMAAPATLSLRTTRRFFTLHYLFQTEY